MSSPTVAVTKKNPEPFVAAGSFASNPGHIALVNEILPFSSISNLSQFLPFLMLHRTFFPVISVVGASIVNLLRMVVALAALSTVILNWLALLSASTPILFP